MHLDGLPGRPQLTYCTNIHAGESWEEISRSLDSHVSRIKAEVSPAAPFGIGLRLSACAAAELTEPGTFERFREQLDRLDAYVFTLNAFPYGPFHGTRVKEDVYLPDWRSPERLAFTTQAARILEQLLGEGERGSISTVPGSFKPVGGEPGAIDLIVENFLRAAAAFARIESETGKRLVLALEPEPCCFLETVEETIGFFQDRLACARSVARLAALTGATPATAEEALRRHLGVCYDVCHGSVEFEDPVEALRALSAAGIAVPKIQLSAALSVPQMSADRLEILRRFNTGVYLHQVVVRHDGLERHLDLPNAFAAYEAGGARGEWRVHCHVPIHHADLGEIGSTRGDLVRVLEALRSEPLSPHLEVETYTWDILPSAVKAGDKAQDIARELRFVLEELGHERLDDGSRADSRRFASAGPGL